MLDSALEFLENIMKILYIAWLGVFIIICFAILTLHYIIYDRNSVIGTGSAGFLSGFVCSS
jgi:hypothetical protein